MFTRKANELPGLEQYKRLIPMDRIGVVAVAIGIGLVALGWLLEELDCVEGAVSLLRIVGGILLLGGIAALLFEDPAAEHWSLASCVAWSIGTWPGQPAGTGQTG